VENIGNHLAQLSEGRLVSYTRSGQLTIWDRTGRFVRHVGRAGQGPGEYAIGPLSMHPTTAGGLLVRDNNSRWTVLDSAFRLTANHPAVAMGHLPRSALLFGDGVLVSADAAEYMGNPEQVFTVWRIPLSRSGAPAVLRRFGTPTPDERETAPYDRVRLLTRAGPDSFWSGPPSASGEGYRLELWTVDGRRLRTLRRSVPWLPGGSDRAGSADGRDLPPPALVMVHAAADGLLIVVGRVANAERWTAARRNTTAEARTLRDDAFDLYLEVIDTRSNSLLAELGPVPVSDARRQWPSGWLSATRGYVPVDLPDGHRGMDLVDLALFAR
jgi:hypothetical protein